MMRRKMACSFCGKSADQVQRLIAGPRVFICDACVAECNAILAAHSPEAGATTVVSGIALDEASAPQRSAGNERPGDG